ncbi:MAG TPA: LLM class flavin-dependent oxidoreductase, partial [Mycobacteriales bacterium]|nr:LLM class flavin-dependent oxidoreductase [Mycobacteriales bacterium]
NPLATAHQLATLDRLSAGRLTVGLGTGYLFSEFGALGADPAQRRDALDENVTLMRQAWAGETITHRNAQFNARGNKVLPPVVQEPHPPLWIHGNSRFGVERAARYGDGWIGMMTHDNHVIARTTRTAPLRDLDSLARRIDTVRASAQAHGRDPDSLEIAVAGAWPMLDIRTRRPADAYLEEIAQLEKLGVDWALSLGCGDDPVIAQETVAQFGEEVVAHSSHPSR